MERWTRIQTRKKKKSEDVNRKRKGHSIPKVGLIRTTVYVTLRCVYVPSVELARTSMKTFGGFIKQQIPTCQEYFMSIALEIFDNNGPRFGIFGMINMENERQHMRLCLVDMHVQIRLSSGTKTMQKKKKGS